MNRKTRGCLVLALVLLAVTPLRAGAAQGENQFRPGLSLGYEFRHDRLRFQFHNPSSYNTAELVPHNFVQTYRADNQWGIVRGRYRALRLNWETEFGATPQKTTYGDDYDTFFQPDGNIIVSGTLGNVSLRSFELRQRVEFGNWRGVSYSLGYRYRRDRSRFQFGTSFETQTKPPSAIVEYLPINETTIAQGHEMQIGARKAWTITPAWSLIGAADLSPTAVATLRTILPDKYPGENIDFLDKGIGLSSRLSLLWDRGRFPLEIYFSYGRNWSYKSQGELQRENSGFGFRVGLL